MFQAVDLPNEHASSSYCFSLRVFLYASQEGAWNSARVSSYFAQNLLS